MNALRQGVLDRDRVDGEWRYALVALDKSRAILLPKCPFLPVEAYLEGLVGRAVKIERRGRRCLVEPIPCEVSKDFLDKFHRCWLATAQERQNWQDSWMSDDSIDLKPFIKRRYLSPEAQAIQHQQDVNWRQACENIRRRMLQGPKYGSTMPAQ